MYQNNLKTPVTLGAFPPQFWHLHLRVADGPDPKAGVRIAARRIETWCKGERRETW